MKNSVCDNKSRINQQVAAEMEIKFCICFTTLHCKIENSSQPFIRLAPKKMFEPKSFKGRFSSPWTHLKGHLKRARCLFFLISMTSKSF